MKRLLPLLLLLLPSAALAHTGEQGSTFHSGVLHPISGLDHILAMVGVGLLAGATGERAIWAMPLTFLTALLVGGVLGAAGVPVPAVEPAILASIVLLGALVALQVKLPLAVVLPAIAIFGVAHGHAHGTEGPTAGLAAYAAGFTLATAALHAAGLGLGLALRGLPARVLGAGTAAAGLALAFA